MTLAQLRYLVAVDAHRSFREAAMHSHVSQPALSMQVKKLEEALGVRVFDRTRQPVVPTTEGEQVLAQARAILRAAERMEEVVQASTEALAGRFVLGVIPTLAPTLMPRFLARFVERYPSVELTIQELETELMLERLDEETLDAGLASTPLQTPGIFEHVLFHETLYAYLPPRHPLLQRSRVRQSDLVEESVWILEEGHCFGTQVLHLCKVHRPWHAEGRARVDYKGGSFETLVRLVDEGLGVTVLPELVVDQLPARRRAQRVRPFAPPAPVREISLIRARRELRQATADAVAKTIEAVLPEPIGTKRGSRSVLSPV